VGLHSNTVRSHLGVLAEVGLVSAKAEERARPACRMLSGAFEPFALPRTIGRQSAASSIIACPGSSLQSPSQRSNWVPGVTIPRGSARLTSALWCCQAIVAVAASAPTASQARRRFSITLSGSSSVSAPRLSDSKAPPLTPPTRVVKATT